MVFSRICKTLIDESKMRVWQLLIELKFCEAHRHKTHNWDYALFFILCHTFFIIVGILLLIFTFDYDE